MISFITLMLVIMIEMEVFSSFTIESNLNLTKNKRVSWLKKKLLPPVASNVNTYTWVLEQLSLTDTNNGIIKERERANTRSVV